MWRDAAFRGYDVVYLIAGLPEAVLAALPAAARTVARAERFRTAPPDPATPARLPADMDDTALIAAARALRRPLALVVAGDRAAVALGHEHADGVEGSRIIGALLGAAMGRPVAPVPPAVRLPVLRALTGGGRAAVRAYLDGRADRRAVADPGTPVAQTPGRFVRLTLDGAEVAALRRTRSTGGRATPMTRAASVALAALAAVAPPERDARVVLPTDLRHLVGGRRVAGNFVSAEAYGTLRGTDWSPAAIGRLLASRRSSGAVPLAASMVRSVLHRSRDGAVRPTVSLSLLGTVDLPEPAPGVPLAFGCATMGPQPGTFVFVAQVGAAITISLWDDTGGFDVAAFPEAFRAEVAARTAG